MLVPCPSRVSRQSPRIHILSTIYLEQAIRGVLIAPLAQLRVRVGHHAAVDPGDGKELNVIPRVACDQRAPGGPAGARLHLLPQKRQRLALAGRGGQDVDVHTRRVDHVDREARLLELPRQLVHGRLGSGLDPEGDLVWALLALLLQRQALDGGGDRQRLFAIPLPIQVVKPGLVVLA